MCSVKFEFGEPSAKDGMEHKEEGETVFAATKGDDKGFGALQEGELMQRLAAEGLEAPSDTWPGRGR